MYGEAPESKIDKIPFKTDNETDDKLASGSVTLIASPPVKENGTGVGNETNDGFVFTGA